MDETERVIQVLQRVQEGRVSLSNDVVEPVILRVRVARPVKIIDEGREASW